MDSTNVVQFAQNIDLLLKVITGLLTLLSGIGSIALMRHFSWKKRVDTHLEDDVGFRQRVLDNMEQTARLTSTHTNALNQHDYRFTVVERQLRGQNQRMRELINSHNRQHKETIEMPAIDGDIPPPMPIP